MTFYQYPDYMYHYGVKGMKWGVRKRVKSAVSSTGEKIKNKTNKMSTKKKVAIGIGVAAGVGAAALGGSYIVNAKRAKRAKQMVKELEHHDATMKWLNDSAKERYLKYGGEFVENYGHNYQMFADKRGYGVRYLGR